MATNLFPYYNKLFAHIISCKLVIEIKNSLSGIYIKQMTGRDGWAISDAKQHKIQ